MLRSTVDTLGPGNPSTDVVTSLDHVRQGYRHAEHLHRWLDRLTARARPCRRVLPARPLAERVSWVFDTEPLVVDLAAAPQAPFAVVRVLLPGATGRG
jgi:hypothetical protein